MILRSLLSRVVASATLVVALGNPAYAQATHTWVSGIGDDVNPCSRTAPCKTFQGAYGKTATGGYIGVLDPGNFGTISIAKSITIDGGPFHAAIIANGTNAISINSTSAKVILRNLDLEGIPQQAGVGIGILVNAATAVHVEDVAIKNFAGSGILFNPAGAGALLYVDHVTIRSTGGLNATNGRVEINHLRAEHNAKGVIASAGVGAIIYVRDSVVTGNGEGFATNNPAAVLNVENSVATHNQFGVSASAGSTIRLSNCHIVSNSNMGLFNDGLSFIVSLEGNSIQGNPIPGSFTSTLVKQ